MLDVVFMSDAYVVSYVVTFVEHPSVDRGRGGYLYLEYKDPKPIQAFTTNPVIKPTIAPC